jgi:uncharacterized protein (UPF0332 family)
MTSRQQSLLEKAKRKLLTARRDFASDSFEDRVSRAYYAMFYVAEAVLDTEGLAFSSHSAVIAAFGQRFVKTGKVPTDFHRYLQKGQDLRLRGDYDEVYQVTREEAAEQMARAEAFMSFVEKLLP